MSNFVIQLEDGEYELSNNELAQHLEENDYLVIGDHVNSLDYEGRLMLEEIANKFLVADVFSREKIYKQVVKEERKNLKEFSNFDMFYHLDEQGFDFLDNIDTQEIISHVEAVGYYVTEASKY